MTFADWLDRFDGLSGAFPRFFEWVAAHHEVVEGFVPGRWTSPLWKERVAPWAIERIFGRPMPDAYYRFLQAYCHIQEWRRWLEIDEVGGLPPDPIEALDLAEGVPPDRIKVYRYSTLPADFYPFAKLGVGGVSYNFWFLDDDRSVVAYFSPSDEEIVPFLFPDMESFMTWEILGALEEMEPGDERRREMERLGSSPEFNEGVCLECAVYITAFALDVPLMDSDVYADDCRERVRRSLPPEKLQTLSRPE